MHRIGKFFVIFATIFCMALVLVATVFDYIVVVPVVAKAHTAIAKAAPSERELPASVEKVLIRHLGSRLKFLAARYALVLEPKQNVDIGQSKRQFTEAGIGFLLPMHFSDKELLSIYASQVYMGPGVNGFSQAADSYVGVPLEQLNPVQAAKLVAISNAPSIYLENPERLEKRIQQLLSEKTK